VNTNEPRMSGDYAALCQINDHLLGSADCSDITAINDENRIT